MELLEHLLILIFVVTRCTSISGFASFVDISIVAAGSEVGLKNYAITAGIDKMIT